MKGGLVRDCKMNVCYDMDTCCDSSYERTFWTKEEKIDALKEYKKNLDMESKAVHEKIIELEKK